MTQRSPTARNSAQGRPTPREPMAALERERRARQRAEEAQRESDARYRTLVEASPDTLVRIRRDGTIVELKVARAFEGIVAMSDFVGRTLGDLLPPELAERGLQKLERVCRTREMETSEQRFPVDAAGSREFEARIVASAEDEVLAVVRDITERKAAERALRQSETRFRRLFEDSPFGIALVGQDLRFLEVSPRLCQLVGYSKEELTKRSFVDITHPDDLETDFAMLRRLRSGEIDSFTVEKRYLRNSGEILPVRVTGAIVRDEDGEPLYGLGVIEDMTQSKQAEAELRAYEAKLRRSERLASIGTLAAGIAHEINNPVGSILLAARFAMGEPGRPASPDVVAKCLRDIADDARRCRRIVKNVLQFGRPEPSEKWPFDLNECARKARDLSEHSAAERSAAIELHLCEEPLPVRMNPTEIEQVLVNVIRNALDAEGEGARVVVRTELAPGTARVIVEDSGRGMTEEQRTYLFDPFYTTRREEGGTGLGLSISHGIVTEHGGTIDADSQPGRGTRVVIEFPTLLE